jgi:hypothetical protein
MRKDKKFLCMIFVPLILMSFVIWQQEFMIVGKGLEEDIVTLTDTFDLQFQKEWHDPVPKSQSTAIPDVNAVVANVPSFIQPNYSVYVGDEIPTTNYFTKYWYTFTVTYLSVIDAHDGGSAGELFLRGHVNKLIDNDMSYTSNWTFDLGIWNDGQAAPLNIVLFNGWAYDLWLDIQLYDQDFLSIDSFGIWSRTLNHENVSTINVNFNGDAIVQFQLEIIGDPGVTSAADLLDAYKPYLYSDVETIYDDPAEFVFGRVIEGYDDVLEYNATCLQYLYYFPYEYTGTGNFVHYWDWEMILIFIDFSAGRYPYRLVWDNGFYFEGPSGYDWIDGQDYKIFDDLLPTGTYLEEITFTEALWPLLGKTRNLPIKIAPLSAVWDSGIEN